MFITKKHLDRRTFLRGALGTAIALPLLDAMVPAFAQSRSGAPLRFGADLHAERRLPGTVAPDEAWARTSSSSRS